jgi:hypothetical protein
VRPTRRSFLAAAASITAYATARRARAYGYDGELGHPVPPPPSLEFKVMSFEKTPLKDQPSTAIIGVPKDIPAGTKLPLVVLLPGGHSNWQPHDAGSWCWWSEYCLGDCEAALRRGTLTEKDFQELVRPEELTQFDAWLAAKPYQGVIVAAAWCLTRDYVLEPNGSMNSAWLRMLVERCRAELPVIPTREATGIGGMSSGGMWALYCGAQCEDVFGTINTCQPYTRELVTVLRNAIVARKTNQRLRIVGALWDRLKEPTTRLMEGLRADGVPFEYVEYLGKHDQRFAAGPGGIDTLLTFDRGLRDQHMDGSPIHPAAPAIALPKLSEEGLVGGGHGATRVLAPELRRSIGWGALAAGGLLGAAAAIGAARARRTKTRA